MDKPTAALLSGSDAFISRTEELIKACDASGDPLLFYSAYVAALFGHLTAALGGDVADAVLETLRPTFNQAARDLEKRGSH